MMDEYSNHFNTSNHTLGRYARHLSFCKSYREGRCELVALEEPAKRCEFIKNNVNCRLHIFLLDYNTYYFCGCGKIDLFRVVCVVLLILVSIFLFWLVKHIVEDYFVPAVTAITRLLNMNEYVAGITIMALSHNIPAFLSSQIAFAMSSRHVFTDSMSVNVFHLLVLSSMVMWIRPFSMDGSFFLMVACFVFLIVSYMDFTIKFTNGYMTLPWAISLFMLCPIYVVVIGIDQFLMHRQNRDVNLLMVRVSRLSVYTMHFATFKQKANVQLFRQFFRCFAITNTHQLRSKWITVQLWALIQQPPKFLMRLIIPLIPLHHRYQAYSKLLSCMQFTITPLACVAISVGIFDLNYFWYASIGTLIVCLPISILAFFNSRTDRLPPWYPYLLLYNLLSCFVVMYAATMELISALEALGIAIQLSHTFIGCTLYTWGSSICEFYSIIVMTRKGYTRMAYSSCFGAAVFDTFGNIAFPFLYFAITEKDHSFKVTEGDQGETSVTLLMIFLLFNIVYGITTNFMMHRSGALLGFTMYILFLVMIVAAEFEVIHSFGTEHSLSRLHLLPYS